MQTIDNSLLYQTATGLRIALERVGKLTRSGQHEQAIDLLQTLGYLRITDILRPYDGPLPVNLALYEWQIQDYWKQIREATPKTLAAKEADRPETAQALRLTQQLSSTISELLTVLNPTQQACQVKPFAQTG